MDKAYISDKFAEFLSKWMSDKFGYTRGANKAAAKFLDISPGHMNNIIAKRRHTSEEWRRQACKKIGINYDEIVFENPRSCDEVSEKQPSYIPSRVIELKHIDTIKRFQNKQLATTINERLVELEKINPAALDQVLGYIDCKINEEQSTARSGDRRKRHMPDQVPITGDRRKLGG